MKKISISFIYAILFLGCVHVSSAQIKGNYEYSKENLFGITKATNSGLIGGFMFKHTWEKKEDSFYGAIIEIVNIKHPQEQRYYSEYGNTFIWGKQNHLYSLRLSFARQRTFFKKASQQGVQVDGFVAIGPTLGFEAPYYVEIRIPGENYTEKVPYDPNKHQWSDIVGSGNFLQGVGQSSVVPGANVKAGLSFEFGSNKPNAVGIELGFQCDFFTRQIIIMPTTENYSIFPSAYFTFFYGSRR